MATINITGTGGIIEGNLGAANVNVNLDPVYGNFNATTSSLSSALADHDDIYAGNGGCFAAWVYPKGIGEGSYGRLFNKGGTYCWISGLSSGFATLKLSADFNGTNGEWNSTSAVIPMDSWSHVAIVYNASATTNDPVMYVNGVSVGVNEDTTPVGAYDDASSTMYIGNNDGGGGGSRTWDGYIMDVKIFKNVAVTATNVAKMASKINVDKDAPDMPTSGLQGWYPLTADDDDDSGEGNNLTAENMGSIVYDAFSVNVQDGGVRLADSGTNSAETLDATETAFTVHDGTQFTAGQIIQVDDERMYIVSIATHVLTVRRGIGGTTAATHSNPVDVYHANATYVSGATTVTQGKVEGLALTSVDFDGTNDLVSTSNASDLSFGDGSSDSAFSISAWIRPDDVDRFRAVTKSNDTQTEYILGTNSSDKTAFHLYDNDTGNNIGMPSLTSISTNVWTHITGTYSGGGSGGLNIYVNGVNDNGTQVTTGSYTAMHNTDGNMEIGRWRDTSTFADGEIRDVKIFDYELGAEQVASLYSGTYPQTSHHYYKLDEGSGTTATDSGTTTQRDGFVSGATYSNGTLDLDGTLTIDATGTLSAPRGNLEVHGEFDINCTTVADQVIHNNGTCVMTGATSLDAGGTTFYNVTCDAAINLRETATIEKLLTVTSGNTGSFNCSQGNVTYTFGTLSSYATIANSGTIRVDNTSSNKPILQGASSLYPVICTGTDWDWNVVSGADWRLANLDYQIALVTGTGSGSAQIQLTGDCEFDAVTVSSGFTLDLNGQRAEFSGLLSSSGTIACGTNALVVADSVNTASSTSGNMNLIETGDGHTHTLTSSTITNWMLNGGTISNSAHGHAADNIIVGAGKLDVGNNLASGTPLVNVTTATGAELDGNTHTITMSGDFTTSGGLLGASCLSFTSDKTGNSGQQDYAQVDDHADLDFANSRNALTLECWFKVDHNDTVDYLFDRRDGQDVFYLHVDPSNKLKGRVFTNGSTSELTGATDVNDQKWHHCALVYKGSTGEHSLYVDGKLDAQETGSGTINASASNMQFGARNVFNDGHFLDGEMDEIRMFAAAKTAAQIRADMFKAEGTALTHFNSLADASTDGLIGRWSCNEGTGSSLVSTGNTDVNAVIKDYNGGSPQTLTGGAWAGAGTFTYGTSTLVMSGSGKKINISANTVVNALTINGTITIDDITNIGRYIEPEDTFTVGGSGTLSSTGSEYLVFTNDYTGGSGQSKALVIGNSSNALANLYKIRLAASAGTLQIPECTTPRIMNTDSGGTVQATGDLTITTELGVSSGATFNANGNTITAKDVDVNGGTLNLSNSTLAFSSSGSFDPSSSSTLLTGNTTINGHSTPTWSSFPQSGGFEVVGDVSNLNIAGGDLTVIGSVTGCTLTGTTTNIRQWHHTLDTQQLLDADSGGDDDLRLTKPALDNSHELMSG